MTRLAILSDIHANLLALDTILKDAAQFEVDQVIVAGDLINCGAYSVQVMERLTAANYALMRGNHEFYLLDYGTPREPESRRGYALPRWLHQIIPAYWYHVIAALPDSLTLYYPDAPPVKVVHGRPGNHWHGLYPTTSDEEMKAALAGVQEKTVITGHTHLPFERHVNGWHVLNAGSAGLPLEGNPGIATYILLHSRPGGWDAEFRRLSYDISPMFEEFERIHFLEAAGATAQMYIEEFKTARLRIAPFHIWRQETYPGQPATMDMAEEFLTLEEGIWNYIPQQYWVNRE
ncbi:MAG: metallophosphoesterase family protein [Anaerolineae bacterium]|nr:metallophosphoesterase family protein [Anaerolineae bacterium]